MIDIKNYFTSIWVWILNCYDNSLFERLMSKIFGFFSRNSEQSVLVDFFKNRFSSGKLWTKSKSARLVRSPFALCRKFYHKNKSAIESIKKESGIYNFMKTALSVSLRDFGNMLALLGIGMLLGAAIWNRNTLSIALGGIILITGGFLSLTRLSLISLAESSSIIGILRKTVSYEGIFESSSASKRLKIGIVIPLLAGIIFSIEPLGSVTGMIAAIGIMMVLYRYETGIYLFVPLSVILPTMALAGLILLTFASFILHLLFSEKGRYVSTPFQPWIALFLGITVYAALSGVAPISGIKIMLIYFAFTMAYVLIVNGMKTRSQWTSLVIIFVIAAAIVALYGIYQNFFLTATTQSWVDEEMFTDIKKRVYSTLDNPNVLGQYFIMLIPISIALLYKIKGGMQKVFYTAINLLMLLCLVYTWSRGAWIGVVLGVGFFALLKDRRWLVICIAALLLMPSVLPASILDRLTSIGNLKDSSTAYRVAVWIGSLRLLKDYWFTGIGLGPDAFLAIYPQYALGGAGFALHSHNFYLQWIVDMGILGLFIYLGIILTGFKQIASVKEKNSLIKTVLLAMAGALLGYLFHGMAENLWYNYRMILVFWIFFGILQSGVMLSDSSQGRKDVLR